MSDPRFYREQDQDIYHRRDRALDISSRGVHYQRQQEEEQRAQEQGFPGSYADFVEHPSGALSQWAGNSSSGAARRADETVSSILQPLEYSPYKQPEQRHHPVQQQHQLPLPSPSSYLYPSYSPYDYSQRSAQAPSSSASVAARPSSSLGHTARNQPSYHPYYPQSPSYTAHPPASRSQAVQHTPPSPADSTSQLSLTCTGPSRAYDPPEGSAYVAQALYRSLRLPSPPAATAVLAESTAPSTQPLRDTRSYEFPQITWEQFQREWHDFLGADYRSARPTAMNRPTPTFDDCEDLCRGLTGYTAPTVDRLKMVIKGINTAREISYPHIAVTGRKTELVERIVSALRTLQTSRSPDYVKVAKLVGQAQGLMYTDSPIPGTSYITSTPSISVPSTSGAYGAVPAQGTASTSNGALPRFGMPSSPRSYSISSTSSSQAAAAQRLPHNQNPRSLTIQPPIGYNYSGGPGYNPYPRSPYAQHPGTPGSAGALRHPSAAPSSSSSSYPYSSQAPSSVPNFSNQIPSSWPKPLTPVPQSTIQGQPAVPINFKPSPFFKIIMAVSTVVELRRATQNDRPTVSAMVHLSEAQRTQLRTARADPKAPQYQLRLYCCSEDHWRPPPPYNAYGNIQKGREGVLIEFPGTCEAKLNGYSVVANLKGIKKKAGTTPPANVGAALTSGKEPGGQPALKLDDPLGPGNMSTSNRVDLTYISTDKLHYMIVYLVEATTIPQIVERIKANKFRSKEEVIKSLQKQAEDTDIQATASSISLRDPLSYTEMRSPVRSAHCPHLQSFDATIYLTMMESTPTWLCPVCNRSMAPDDLVWDGFSEDIKKAVPSSYDTVIVEVDGTWRTEDSKHGTAKKVQEAREAAAAQKLRDSQTPLPPGSSSMSNGNGIVNGSSSGTGGRAHSDMSLSRTTTPFEAKPDVGELSNENGNAGRASRFGKGKASAEVIDLDDDDDDDDYTYMAMHRGSAIPSTGTATSSNTAGPSTSSSAPNGNGGRSTSRTAGAVIDLTLSDSDDDDAGPIPHRGMPGSQAAQKRRADSDLEQPDTSRTRYA